MTLQESNTYTLFLLISLLRKIPLFPWDITILTNYNLWELTSKWGKMRSRKWNSFRSNSLASDEIKNEWEHGLDWFSRLRCEILCTSKITLLYKTTRFISEIITLFRVSPQLFTPVILRVTPVIHLPSRISSMIFILNACEYRFLIRSMILLALKFKC